MRLATAVGLVVFAAVAALLWLGRVAPVESPPAAQPAPLQQDARAVSVAQARAAGAGGSKAVAKADVRAATPAVRPGPTDIDADHKRRALEEEKLARLAPSGNDPPANAGGLAFFPPTQRAAALYARPTVPL